MLVHSREFLYEFVDASCFFVDVPGFLDERVRLALPSALFNYFGNGFFIDVLI